MRGRPTPNGRCPPGSFAPLGYSPFPP
jgi:hypothetical protein